MEFQRQSLLDKIQSKIVSIEEFNYDALVAPPLFTLLDASDINRLYKIATSVKLSGNVRKKYEMIDEVMKPRGFMKLSAGTNRVVYRHLESNDFVVKVAVDAIGIGDNPREFVNQFIFKPFVTKVFEVSPCGTVGVFERVNPITSREEFMSVADDIYDAITNLFIGKYIMADIGTKFFMNWGIRSYNSFRHGSAAFGPVLLDFPYVYELDGNRLFCKNITETGQLCGGIIDYDDGFNFLVCSKCGARHRIAELAKRDDSIKMVTIDNRRECNMKIKNFWNNGKRVEGYENEKINSDSIVRAESVEMKNAVSKVSVNMKKLEKLQQKETAEESVVEAVTDKTESEILSETYKVVVEEIATVPYNPDDPVVKEEEDWETEDDISIVTENRECTCKSEIAELEKALADIKEELRVAKEDNDKLNGLLNTANSNSKKFSEAVDEKDEKILELEAELKYTRENYNESVASNEELTEKIKLLEVENAKVSEYGENLLLEIEKFKAAKDNMDTTGAIPLIVNDKKIDISSKYYGDATVLEGVVERISGFANPEEGNRSVIVFPTGDDYLASHGAIVALVSINGYLIDDLIAAKQLDAIDNAINNGKAIDAGDESEDEAPDKE